MTHFSGPALPMDDVRWIACAQAEFDAMTLRDQVSLDQALGDERPTWLANIHREPDAAVAKAYGWDDYTPEMPDEEILRQSLALNLERSM